MIKPGARGKQIGVFQVSAETLRARGLRRRLRIRLGGRRLSFRSWDLGFRAERCFRFRQWQPAAPRQAADGPGTFGFRSRQRGAGNAKGSGTAFDGWWRCNAGIRPSHPRSGFEAPNTLLESLGAQLPPAAHPEKPIRLGSTQCLGFAAVPEGFKGAQGLIDERRGFVALHHNADRRSHVADLAHPPARNDFLECKQNQESLFYQNSSLRSSPRGEVKCINKDVE